MYMINRVLVIVLVLVFVWYYRQPATEEPMTQESIDNITSMVNSGTIKSNNIQALDTITAQNATINNTLTATTVNATSMTMENVDVTGSFKFVPKCRLATGPAQDTGGGNTMYLDRLFGGASLCNQNEYVNWIWYKNLPNNQAQLQVTCCGFMPQ